VIVRAVQLTAVAVISMMPPLVSWQAPVRAEEPRMRSHVVVRGIYGGVPTQIFDRGKTLSDYGINAVWVGAGGLDAGQIAHMREQGAQVFAEFNTMHDASYLKEHPEAAPIGPDGQVCPPPDGWQGVCPTHPGYRRWRMGAFRQVLVRFPVDGIWLDYHHAMASWEQANPALPDTCFCEHCLAQFVQETGVALRGNSTADRARILLGERKREWVNWRCGVLTDWVREFKSIRDEVRPQALLGTFHCPWSDTDFDGALRSKLAIDLKSQSRYLDVFSPMPYHARFGHARDPGWISRQTAWLGKHLGVEGLPTDRKKIWPIVQLSEWGQAVPLEQMDEVLDHGTRPPATGVTVFVWGKLYPSWEKVEAMGAFYRKAAEK
jgi:hypothetical protein